MKTINFAVSEHNSRVYSLIFLGDNMKFKKYATKTLMIVIGSIISAYGITLAIGAGFGGATLAILWQGLTNVTGMSIGTSSLIVAVAMIIFALFYDRKKINIGTILYQIIYSFFVDVFTKIQHYTDIKAVNFVIMLLGIAIFSFGTGIYSAADFGRGSYEAVTFSLAEKNGWKIKIVRMVLDIIMVIIGVLLGGKFGICTIATVLLSGPIIQATVSTVKKSKILKNISYNSHTSLKVIRHTKRMEFDFEQVRKKWTIEKTELRLYPLTKTLAKAQKA